MVAVQFVTDNKDIDTFIETQFNTHSSRSTQIIDSAMTQPQPRLPFRPYADDAANLQHFDTVSIKISNRTVVSCMV